jgi:hypothetical protein
MTRPKRSDFAAAPSARLLGAAVAGLVSVSLGGCGASTPEENSGTTEPKITSSRLVEGLTADGFKALCDARGGTVEVLAHCGGLASARGFSYDVGTQLLSEHTCKGANTCGGWNCITDS